MAWKVLPEEGAAVSVATVAAASNTTAYIAKYGGGHYHPGDNEESSKDASGEGKGIEGKGYILGATDYNDYDENYGGELGSLSSHKDIDDDDYVDIDINSDLEDEMHFSFPKNVSRASKLVVGGPQARDMTGMMDSQKEAIEHEEKILQKK